MKATNNGYLRITPLLYNSAQSNSIVSAESYSMNKRPLGVAILAVLHFVGGIALLGVTFLAFPKVSEAPTEVRLLRIPPTLLLMFGMIPLSVAVLVSGIGMWFGRTWGWWLGAFYYVIVVAGNAALLIALAVLGTRLQSATHDVNYHYLKHGFRLALHLVVLWYFFNGNVLEYFRLRSLNKRGAICTLIENCIAIAVFVASVAVFF